MILGPTVGELDERAVLDAYAWPTEGRWLRAMMVTTLDGAAAGPDGLSGSISGDVDKAVFTAVRRGADAVLVGAGTMRAERYGPLRARPEDAQSRREAGQHPAPTLVFVSGSLDLPWDEPVFRESTMTPIVVTGGRPDPAALARARQRSEVVQLAADDVRPGPLLAELDRRGLRRVVCEGGPSLLESLVKDELLDEADITVSPMFAGTDQTPRTPGLAEVARLDLRHVITGDSFLMLRYVRPDVS